MAGRNLTAAMSAALAAGEVRPAIFVEAEFAAAGSPDGTEYLRLWTGAGDKTWNGSTWTGAGQLLEISPVRETRDVQAIGFTVSLSGLADLDMQRVLARSRQGKNCTLWLAMLDTAGAIIDDPYQLQKGRMDYPVIDDSGPTCVISAQFESRLIDLERPRIRRYTHEDQQLDYPGDLGFQYVPRLQDAQFAWG